MHVAAAEALLFIRACPAHEAIGAPWSRNSTNPDGATEPRWIGVTVTVYVALEPTLTVGFETSRAVEVASRPTARSSVALVESATIDPRLDVNTAATWAGEVAAENDVWQVTVALWKDVATGMNAQPLRAAPRASNVIAPEGVAALELDVTVAINVTT